MIEEKTSGKRIITMFKIGLKWFPRFCKQFNSTNTHYTRTQLLCTRECVTIPCQNTILFYSPRNNKVTRIIIKIKKETKRTRGKKRKNSFPEYSTRHKTPKAKNDEKW